MTLESYDRPVAAIGWQQYAPAAARDADANKLRIHPLWFSRRTTVWLEISIAGTQCERSKILAQRCFRYFATLSPPERHVHEERNVGLSQMASSESQSAPNSTTNWYFVSSQLRFAILFFAVLHHSLAAPASRSKARPHRQSLITPQLRTRTAADRHHRIADPRFFGSH